MRLRWVYGSLAEHDNRVVATHNANSVVQIQIALRRSGNAIIVARKAGIDLDFSRPLTCQNVKVGLAMAGWSR
jgi:hypothetical protein